MRVKLKKSLTVGAGYILNKGQVYPATRLGNNKEFKKHGFVALHFEGNTFVLVKGEYQKTLKRGE
tara:strand:- start:7 stop:201 length:195 start_codon:yes stop_codon:yes gene_type:complete